MPESDLLVANYVIQGSYGELKLVDSTSGAAVNEVQSLEVASATGGTFKLTFGGQQTAAIAYNATAAVVQAALLALANLAPGDVAGAGGALGAAPVTLTFGGAYAGRNVGQIVVDGSALVGAGAAAVITTSTQGSPAGTTTFLANVHEVQGKFTTNKVEIRRSGTRRMAYKRGMITGDGTITEFKVTSEFLQKFVDEFHDELTPPSDVMLDVILDDPEALGTEVLRLSGVKLWEIDFGWKVGDLVDEAIPFTFEDAELVSPITGTMTA